MMKKRTVGWMRILGILLLGGSLATFALRQGSGQAWGETVELVTYFPSTAQAGDLHLRSLTVGDGFSNEVLANGDVLIESRLGIGTIEPGAMLEVVGNADTGFDTLLRLMNPNNDAAGLFLGAANRQWAIAATNPASGFGDQKLVFFDVTAGFPDGARMVIDRVGNVGIGTTTPLTPLHSFGIFIDPDGDTNTTNPHHRGSAVFDAMSEDINRGYSSTYTGGLTNFIALSYNDQPGARLGFYANVTNGTIDNLPNSTNSTFYINTDPKTVLATSSPSFVITDAGDVGIGQTDPGPVFFNPPNGLRRNLVVTNDIFIGAANNGNGAWLSQATEGTPRVLGIQGQAATQVGINKGATATVGSLTLAGSGRPVQIYFLYKLGLELRNGATYTIRVKIGGTTVLSVPLTVVTNWESPDNINKLRNLMFYAHPSSGTHTYAVEITNTTVVVGIVRIIVSRFNMAVLEY